MIAICLASLSVDARTFTDVRDSKIEASIISVANGEVDLKLDKGDKIYKIAVSKFSIADQEYIKSWQEAKEKKAEEMKKEAEPNDEPQRSGRGLSTKALKKKYTLEDNFDAEWPKLVSIDLGIKIDTVEENEEERKFVYHSPNYEFISDVGLSRNVIKKFAVLFEGTREFCRLLPISTMKAHLPGAQFRHKILLFESQETYVENGGHPSSSGVFMSRRGNGIVMAPLTSLGVKKVGSSFMFDYKGSNKVLPHELTHQLTDGEYYQPGARGWFSEGLAEYVAVTPYRSGKFMVRSNRSSIKDYVTEYGKKGRGGRALGTEINAPDLKEYMLQPYSSFIGEAEVNFNYGMSLLITNYFFHMEDDRSNIVSFMKALKEGKQGEEALKTLLNGRTFDELEEQISKAWKSRGVRITFK